MEKNIIGTWKLIQFELKIDDEISYPFGKDPSGYLIYSDDGYVSVLISKENRETVSTEDINNVPEIERMKLADGFIGYSGKYKIFDDKIVHYVDISFIPNWVGRPLERFYQIDDFNLILETPAEKIGGSKFISSLKWKKI